MKPERWLSGYSACLTSSKTRAQIPRTHTHARWAWQLAFISSLGRGTGGISWARWLALLVLLVISVFDWLPQRTRQKSSQEWLLISILRLHAHTCTHKWEHAHIHAHHTHIQMKRKVINTQTHTMLHSLENFLLSVTTKINTDITLNKTTNALKDKCCTTSLWCGI